MPWFRMDDQLCSHPKWLACSMGARGVWASAASWCAGHSHDGIVPRPALKFLGGTLRQAAELVDAGLWEPQEDGWLFHDWDHYQPTTEQVEADRAAARERQRRARERAASRRDSPVTNGSVTVPPSRPVPTPLLDTSLGVTSVDAADPETGGAAVDFDHHDRPRHDDYRADELVAGVRSVRDAVFARPAERTS